MLKSFISWLVNN